jgi:methylmalonyl-CoA mutase C-terminal domain/subunit
MTRHGAPIDGTRRIRVLVGKPGLDGHDVGAKLVCRALMEAGMEVIYTGLRQSPEAIARAAVQEAVDVVGLSILSGAHLGLARRVRQQLDALGARDLPLFVGGVIPAEDRPELAALGVTAVLPTGTPFGDIVEAVRRQVTP